MHDDILEACARDELRGLGLGEDDVAEALATMREQGLFAMPPGDVVAAARAESDEMAVDDGPDPDVTEMRRAWRASLRGSGGN